MNFNFKYIIEYSFEHGQIANTVGCHTYNQAKEIGEAIYDGNKKELTVDFVRITDVDGKILDVLVF